MTIGNEDGQLTQLSLCHHDNPRLQLIKVLTTALQARGTPLFTADNVDRFIGSFSSTLREAERSSHGGSGLAASWRRVRVFRSTAPVHLLFFDRWTSRCNERGARSTRVTRGLRTRSSRANHDPSRAVYTRHASLYRGRTSCARCTHARHDKWRHGIESRSEQASLQICNYFVLTLHLNNWYHYDQ